MRVFVTGASGFIGSAIVQELIAAGHQVLGLARSEASAQTLAQAGAEALRGSLEDADSLKQGASATDGVIHTAFIHDFSNYTAAAATDKAAIEAIGAVLAGTQRPFVITGGILGLQPRHELTDEDDAAPDFPRASESAGIALASQGVKAAVIRLPPSVHDQNDHGFVPALINIAREKGVSAYIGDGSNRWPAVHRLDAAQLFRLALEQGAAGSRFNAIGDEGIPTREIAEIIGQQLNLPTVSIPTEKAAEHFGWIGRFFALNGPASAVKTKARLGWQPAHIGLLEDMQQNYFRS